MKDETVTIHCDARPVLSVISELQASQLPPQLRDLILDELHGGGQFVRVHAEDPPAPGANNVRVRLEPSDGLLRLLAAVRARNAQLDGPVEHTSPPQTSLKNPGTCS